MNVEQLLNDLRTSALERIAAAATSEQLEAMRVDVLGRNGAIAGVSKDFKKLTPEDRARIGKLLNEVKQEVEASFETKNSAFAKSALDARLEVEWIDLTLPAPGAVPLLQI